MPKDIHQRDTAQQRSSRLLLAMGIIVLLGALAYFVLTLVVNRRTPASPDTRYTAENGISVYYESAVWPVCEMTEDATLGRALELASAQSSDDANYQVVLFQKGTKDTYEDFIGQSEKELQQAYGVISPRKVDLNIDGAAVTAVPEHRNLPSSGHWRDTPHRPYRTDPCCSTAPRSRCGRARRRSCRHRWSAARWCR